MKRIVEPEMLDTLPPDDLRAVRSRRDLRRVNAWMCNHQIMAEALRNESPGRVPQRITELGAGDGKLLLRVAQKISPSWPGVPVALLDRQNIVSVDTIASFAKLGWRAVAVVADVFDWQPASDETVVANLFLHHFENERLEKLFYKVSKSAEWFVAVEPRRDAWPLFCSRLLWAIGCNAITRHDAVVSVRAGFSGKELSALWPDTKNWRLTEHSAGPFGHLFIARRIK